MKTAFLDVDTQLDFLYPGGALYVPGGEDLVPAIAHLNRFAASHGIPVVSTMDAHAENDIEFERWPHHCVAGTLGQRKAEATLLERRITVPNREGPLAIEGSQQIIVEKQTVDVFASLNLGRVIDALAADQWVLYGVVTEVCVLYAALGLLRMGKSVIAVTDAVASLKAEDSVRALEQIEAAGGRLAMISQVPLLQ